MPLLVRSPRLIAGVLASTLLAGTASAQFTYDETFSGTSAAGWTFYSGNSEPGPRLTAGAAPVAADPEFGKTSAIDAVGSGWLRLATTTANQANAAYFDSALPALGNAITIEFSVAMWGDKGDGAGGDGLTFFMRDASQPFSVGAFGGSMGYAQKTGIAGLSGGYFGVALDVFGNFSSATEGRVGGPGANDNSVAIRGPAVDSYRYLRGTADADVKDLTRSLAAPTATSRPDQATQYRDVRITLTATNQLTVAMRFGEDNSPEWKDVVTANMGSYARPEMMSFGFSAGTGGANQVYEVGNSFSVTATNASNLWVWDGGGSNDNWTRNGNWVSTGSPHGTGTNVFFQDENVAGSTHSVVLDTDRTVGSVYFEGTEAYTLSGRGRLDLDASSGSARITVLDGPGGDADHRINTNVRVLDNLVIENYVANRSLTFGGTVDAQSRTVTVQGDGNTVFAGALTGNGALVKRDSGTLEFDSTAQVSSLTASGGTIQLDTASVTSNGAITITGNTVIDFLGTAASTLNFSTLSIAAGVTLTLANWTDAVDAFFVTHQPSAGTLSQIVFSGYQPGAAWVNGQIRPVPEPATYGAILGVLALGAFVTMRLRERRRRS